MLQNQLTDMLGISYPVLSAGMARVAQAELTAAVSNAGGLGCLGGVSFMAPQLTEEIGRIRAATSLPFAVNLLLPESLVSTDEASWAPLRERWEAMSADQRSRMTGVEALLTRGAAIAQAQVVLDEAPPVVVLTFATPSWFVDDARARGILVGAMVGSVGGARRAAEAGVDFVIAQGTEGGGHTGYVSTLALVPAVVDAVPLPVVAAGGITDGRGLAAALALGAQGVWVGTRFIATDEAFGHEAFKRRVVESGARDLVLTRAYTGKPLRAFRNAWTSRWENRDSSVRPFPAQYAVAADRVESGYQDGDLDEGMMPAGQGVETITSIVPAAEVVHSMVSEAVQTLATLASGIRPSSASAP